MNSIKKVLLAGLFGWLPFIHLVIEVRDGALETEAITLYRGDSLHIHHPLSKLDRVLLKMHGISYEIG